MGSCLTHKEWIENFVLEFNDGDSVTIKNRWTDEIIFDDSISYVRDSLLEMIKAIDKYNVG